MTKKIHPAEEKLIRFGGLVEVEKARTCKAKLTSQGITITDFLNVIINEYLKGNGKNRIQAIVDDFIKANK